MTALVAALDTDDPRRRADRLREAEDACAEYGRIAGREGLGAPMTADLFLRFRRPFLAELGALARRREFDAAATSSLMADANAALDGLLLATLRGWEAAALGAGRRPRRARLRPPRPEPPIPEPIVTVPSAVQRRPDARPIRSAVPRRRWPTAATRPTTSCTSTAACCPRTCRPTCASSRSSPTRATSRARRARHSATPPRPSPTTRGRSCSGPATAWSCT